jgi:hypothetical protein
MRLFAVGLALALAAAGFADTVTLKDGRVVHGTYLGGSPRQVKLEVGSQIQTLDVADITTIEFGHSAPQAEVEPPPPPPPPPPPARDRDQDRPRLVRNEPEAAPAPAAEVRPSSGVDLPAGTNLVVRMIDGVDSEVARVGQTFSASLDQPVLDVSGQNVLIPRGADVVVKLVDAKESGTFTGRAGLTLNLQSVKVNGRVVEVNSQSISRVGSSQGTETAKRTGAGAVVGAGLGAIFGGGKGAAAGAAVGGAAGAGTQVFTKGQKVKIPSETRLTFVLESPIRL